MPEYAAWRGVRVLYCSEPNHDDKLNSGILKELTGGEPIMYRLLFSNDVHRFRPQFKLHMMCNDAPQLDGGDSGVQRRTRKIDYISCFVEGACVDPERHRYPRDPTLVAGFKHSVKVRLAFIRQLLCQFQHSWEFTMPAVVRDASSAYLEENDGVRMFAAQCIVPDANSYFTLADAQELFKRSPFYSNKPKTLKTDLQRVLGAACIGQKRVQGVRERSVFEGFWLEHSGAVLEALVEGADPLPREL